MSSPRGRAPKTVTSKARRGGAKGGAGATKAGANDKLVPIYCGQGSWKQLGTYNVDTGLVDPKVRRHRNHVAGWRGRPPSVGGLGCSLELTGSGCVLSFVDSHTPLHRDVREVGRATALWIWDFSVACS